MLFVVFKNTSTDPLNVPVLSSEMEEHNNFVANGTLPQVCLTFILSDLFASGSNSWTRFREDCSSSSLILKAWCPLKRRFKNWQDSLVVRRNVTLSLRLRISPIKSITYSLTSGRPLSKRSSALSRMKTKGFVIWAKIEQSSSSAVKRCDAVAGCVSNPRNLDVRSLFSLRPRNERKYPDRPCAWRQCPMAITVDVFPNPGELHMETRRVASLFSWAMTSTAVSIVIKSNSPLNIIPELIWEVWLH